MVLENVGAKPELHDIKHVLCRKRRDLIRYDLTVDGLRSPCDSRTAASKPGVVDEIVRNMKLAGRIRGREYLLPLTIEVFPKLEARDAKAG